ncbi:putative nucleoporin GLE1 [Podospora australis]|uniref:mRNA export factor GLE1 n=1 Tax=Podospora australis TaxID=1536484 RepID=A0AAN6X808_9PEZI|nr:putative nucleoporin GLE1 [Podospora australis]
MQRGSPSPARRSQFAASPQRPLSEIFDEGRNSEARHRLVLEASQKEHIRVREEAERILNETLLRDEQQRVLEERQREERRIRAEEQLASERVRLNALKAKKVEIPPLLPDPEPPAAPPAAVNGKATPTTTSQPAAATARADGPSTQPTVPTQVNGSTLLKSQQTPAAQPLANPITSNAPVPAATPTPALSSPKPTSSALGINGLLNNNVAVNGTNAPPATSMATPPPQPPAQDRYTEIHKNLKALRRSMVDQAKNNQLLKNRMGDMRREIRKCVGQLVSGVPSKNRGQQQTIVGLLREALANQVGSQLVDPSSFVLAPRNPIQNAIHNDPVLPSLFIYLLNIFAKAAVSQFINEASARPETADPVGVCIAAAFSEPDFLWRGVSMIEILLAKLRIVCPVLFGYRGSEKTEQGRQRLGWWKDHGRWIPEQQHMDRMTGLGAGFAAISLRKFAQSKKQNPFPARHYWTAMARIVNTPPAEISNTQCIVLKAMVQNYESKFIESYGNAAIAALRTALIEFPAKATEKSAAVSSLQVLAQVLKRDTGLILG